MILFFSYCWLFFFFLLLSLFLLLFFHAFLLFLLCVDAFPYFFLFSACSIVLYDLTPSVFVAKTQTKSSCWNVLLFKV
ncbi:hypothetical protein STCU_12270 [Strigomonas culicis]|uniref:Uncharacterized protein n=1 Tax=Strigomonas culicis TaxID=28005 RepID=S9TE14_9TRYP|nr:hypothetical protein STCU_12270 [Strigomonas culicis]|eukprot:EPY15189.1 hypothetical protein STCU_12270 [Strigomonas culicis]